MIKIGTAVSSTNLWNTKSGKLIASPLPETHRGQIETLVYTADGRSLIVCHKGVGYTFNLGRISFISAKSHNVVDSLPVSNYGSLGDSAARNAIRVGSFPFGALSMITSNDKINLLIFRYRHFPNS